jgi:hypothetical protein
MIKIHCYNSKNGYPHALVEKPYELLGWFLESDVQGSLENGQEIKILINEVRTGKIPYSEGVGNAYNLILTPSGARIETEFATPNVSLDITLNELDDALSAWLDFLGKRYKFTKFEKIYTIISQ